MKLFGYLENQSKGMPGEEKPPFTEQVKTFIEEVRLKAKKKDRSVKTVAIITLMLYLYLTGVLASVFRHFGEMVELGYRNAPPVEFTPWGAIGALFSFKYSLIAILLTLVVAASVLGWWIRSHIGLGRYDLEERGGLKFKKQAMDATLGSAREMTEEEIVQTFTVTPENEFTGRKNPGRIIFGRDKETGDYITEQNIPQGARPNRNTITIGSAGCYKTSGFIIPLILQLSRAGENMIINDPSTEISMATKNLLESRGYEIKIFNIMDPEVSDGWNFISACGENPIISKTFAHMIIDGSAGKGKAGDSFWPEGMYVLLSALILYVNTTESPTIEYIRHILNNISLDNYPALFEELDDNHPAKMEFNTYMTSPVQRNVLNGAAQRLAIFNSSSISRICSSEGIDIISDFGTAGKRTAVFIVASDVESTFSFVPSLFLTAAAVQLTDYAKRNTRNLTLPQHVHFIMDEFSNTARIEDIGRYLSTTRKYGLVFHLIIQSLPQFYKRYDENEVLEIIGNCQYTLGFGSGEPMTADFFEKYCGPTTVRTGMTSSNSVVLKSTDQFREGEQQRSLFFANEILTMDPNHYLLLTNGKHPLVLKKAYWKELEDSKRVNNFIMSEYVPQYAEYIPLNIPELTKESTTNNSQNKSTSADNQQKKKKKKSKDVPDTSIPPENGEIHNLYDVRYYADRPAANPEDIYTKEEKIKEGNYESSKRIHYMKNETLENGNPKRAVLVAYDINVSECDVNGKVPDNRYMAVKTKKPLEPVEVASKLSKENSILVGWRMTYTKSTKYGAKRMVTERRRTDQKDIFVDENGVVCKSGYCFYIPESDCEISPIFITAKGAEKEAEPEVAETVSGYISTANNNLRL